jgi:hypothetical protein
MKRRYGEPTSIKADGEAQFSRRGAVNAMANWSFIRVNLFSKKERRDSVPTKTGSTAGLNFAA